MAAVVLSLVLLSAAISAYPGGSELDPRAPGFDARTNYVCDLLRQDAIGGQPNPAGPLARAAILAFVAGLVSFFAIVPTLFPDLPGRGRLVRGAGVASSIAWVALSLAPSDRFAVGHAVFVVAGVAPGVVAAAVAVLGLAARRGTRALSLLGVGALVGAALDAALYLVVLLTGDVAAAVVVPVLQKIAGAFLIAWMLGVAAAVLSQAPRRRPDRERVAGAGQ